MFYMNYPRCGDCAYSHISFIGECTDAKDVSYVTGEGVELTVHNKSGRVISSCAIYSRQIIIEFG